MVQLLSDTLVVVAWQPKFDKQICNFLRAEGWWWPQGGVMDSDQQLLPNQLDGANWVHSTMHLMDPNYLQPTTTWCVNCLGMVSASRAAVLPSMRYLLTALCV